VVFHIVTIFPEFFRGPFQYGVIERACRSGLIEIRVHDLRTWTHDRHRTVDDRPFGGAEGMVLKAEPIFDAVESIWGGRKAGASESLVGAPTETASEEVGRKVVLLSAQGRRFDQAQAREFAGLNELLLICGRYEGVDERVAEHLADEELSIGDYVLSGGELAAAVVVDSVARLRSGVLGNRDSAVYESFSEDGLLDCPQYTRPAEFRGWKAPDVLLGGNHEEIRRWRREAARQKTARLRPDLLKDRSRPDLLQERPGSTKV
jgi:tRNA (guanine37-N1)-methyltransferase